MTKDQGQMTNDNLLAFSKQPKNENKDQYRGDYPAAKLVRRSSSQPASQ
jgi:hypothetical protein